MTRWMRKERMTRLELWGAEMGDDCDEAKRIKDEDVSGDEENMEEGVSGVSDVDGVKNEDGGQDDDKDDTEDNERSHVDGDER